MAAWLSGPAVAVASMRPACLLRTSHAMPDRRSCEVTALRHLRRHSPHVVWHESHHLTEARRDANSTAIPVTRPVRTFLDLAVVVDAKAASSAVYFVGAAPEHARRSAAIWRRVGAARAASRTGTGKLTGAPRAADVPVTGPTESDLETLFFQLLSGSRPDDARPARSASERRGSQCRIDFAVPGATSSASSCSADRFHFGRRRARSRRPPSARNDLGDGLAGMHPRGSTVGRRSTPPSPIDVVATMQSALERRLRGEPYASGGL